MRKLLLAVAVAASTGALATTALAASRTIKVGDDFFVRDNGNTHSISVAKGTTVRFKWVGSALHDVHATRGPVRFKSALKSSGTFSRTLSRSGTYRLVCDVHPTLMKLTVRVR